MAAKKPERPVDLTRMIVDLIHKIPKLIADSNKRQLDPIRKELEELKARPTVDPNAIQEAIGSMDAEMEALDNKATKH